jgi:hypothetical protein
MRRQLGQFHIPFDCVTEKAARHTIGWDVADIIVQPVNSSVRFAIAIDTRLLPKAFQPFKEIDLEWHVAGFGSGFDGVETDLIGILFAPSLAQFFFAFGMFLFPFARKLLCVFFVPFSPASTCLSTFFWVCLATRLT